MAETTNLRLVEPAPLPCVDLEFIREYVNGIPAGRLEEVAMTAWTAAKMGFAANTAHSLYVVAYVMSRLADERIMGCGAA
jgi:hypothetical protein